MTNLRLKHPCALDWDALEDGKAARLCQLCGKQVVDFTRFTDKELKDWFAANATQSCGLFTLAQVGMQTPGIWKSLFAGLALFFGHGITTVKADHSPAGQLTSAHTDSAIFKGSVVTNSKGVPHAGARIMILYKNQILGQAVAAADGRFQLSVSALQPNTEYEIVIESRNKALRIHDRIRNNEISGFLNRAILLEDGEARDEVKPKLPGSESSKIFYQKKQVKKFHFFKRKQKYHFRPMGCPEF